MKKLPALLFCLVLALSLCLPALAEEGYIPDDDFYLAHADACVPAEQEYSSGEKTAVYKSPLDSTNTGAVLADETCTILFLWQDEQGDTWGYTEFWRSSTHTNGWINLTHPDHNPVHTGQPGYVTVLVCVFAVAAAGIMLIGRKRA